MSIKRILKDLNIKIDLNTGTDLTITSPIDGKRIAELNFDTSTQLSKKIEQSITAFNTWRNVPAPQRGELIRIFGLELRKNKNALGKLVTLECGKILEEGLGEVQEMIDICDYAVGLSRTIGGLTLPSERANHIMHENWYPLGPTGIISAFNFPVAVWSWNAALAIICGNSIIWKPSEKTPLTALACQKLFERATQQCTYTIPDFLSQTTIGNAKTGAQLVNDKRIKLISATGSSHMGQIVGPQVASRFGRSILELGGNNAVIVSQHADLNIAIPSILFGAVGTAGQRCTTTRRVFAHKDIYDKLFNTLKDSYIKLDNRIGNPLEKNTLIGPLIDLKAFLDMEQALKSARQSGAMVFGGKRVLENKYPTAYYVEPALVRTKSPIDISLQETFAPILYVIPYTNLTDAISMQNAATQGLSSAIFTTDLREAEYFKQNSDCGLANVNIGTSGAEIGGAFGGEKETGGGRESGSDAWKSYMRRQTSTTYYGNTPPELAQGVSFE